MNILTVSISDKHGGAARAAYRLHKSLLDEGVGSKMLVQHKISDDYTVLAETSRIRKTFNVLRSLIETIPIKIFKKKKEGFFSPSWFGFSNIVDRINEIDPDIVHLHWINDGMIKIEDLANINAPIVWSLHDMWAFTGGYHYDGEDRDYLHDGTFLEKWVYNRKQKIFSKIDNMTIVGLSRWLYESSQNSMLLQEKQHIHLPNPINTRLFKKLDNQKARALWNLPQDKKLILFGALGATSDPRKGFSELKKALEGLKSNEIELVIFGSSEPKSSENFAFKTHYVGSLKDDISLVTLYSAVDVTVVPSLEENLSNVIMESLSCATPVVGFDIGGNSDMIEHKINGYLAKAFESQDLANGIEWVLNNESYDELCKNAREKVLKEFDSKIVAKRYIELYKGILDD